VIRIGASLGDCLKVILDDVLPQLPPGGQADLVVELVVDAAEDAAAAGFRRFARNSATATPALKIPKPGSGTSVLL
jgi:hypothetical protein